MGSKMDMYFTVSTWVSFRLTNQHVYPGTYAISEHPEVFCDNILNFLNIF
jgi:hypothetical protein